MGHVICKQFDGKYSVFSTIVDDFIITDAVKEDIIAYRLEDATKSIKDHVDKELRMIEACSKEEQVKVYNTFIRISKRNKK